MKKRSEVLDVLVILSGMSVFILLIMGARQHTMLGYAIVMILVTFTLLKAAENYNKRWERKYIQRVIKQRKHS